MYFTNSVIKRWYNPYSFFFSFFLSFLHPQKFIFYRSWGRIFKTSYLSHLTVMKLTRCYGKSMWWYFQRNRSASYGLNSPYLYDNSYPIRRQRWWRHYAVMFLLTNKSAPTKSYVGCKQTFRFSFSVCQLLAYYSSALCYSSRRQ